MFVAFPDLDAQPTEADESEADQEAGDGRPVERPAGSARGLRDRVTSGIDAAQRIGQSAQKVGSNLGKRGAQLLGTVFGPGSKIKIGVIVIDLGVYLLATVLFVIGLTTMSIGNSGSRGTTPEQRPDLTEPSTLSDLQAIQCLQEEAQQAETKDATIGTECAQQIRNAAQRMKTNIEAIRKRIPTDGDGSSALSKLDEFQHQVEHLTELRKIDDLQQHKRVIDENLVKLNSLLSKAGVAGGLSGLAGKETSTKLTKIRVLRNKQIVQLYGEGGVIIGSARIGIGDGSGDGGNYLKKSGFVNGDHVTPLGSFQTGYRERKESGVYSGQFGSYMGKEVIEYTGGVASGRGLLFHSGKADYDQRNPLPFTYGCVRLTSSDMRILYNLVDAQKKSVPIEIVDQ